MPKVILPTAPASTYFFSPGFSAGFAGFRQVPPVPPVPPGSAGFLCRVLLGSRLSPGQLRRVVPGFSGFPPTRFLLQTPLEFIARIVPGSCQASVKVAAIKEAFSAIAQALSKSAYGKNQQ